MLQIIFFFVNDYRLIDALQIVNLLLQCDISEMTAVTLLQCYQEKTFKIVLSKSYSKTGNRYDANCSISFDTNKIHLQFVVLSANFFRFH